jgi:hypothetical protein
VIIYSMFSNDKSIIHMSQSQWSFSFTTVFSHLFKKPSCMKVILFFSEAWNSLPNILFMFFWCVWVVFVRNFFQPPPAPFPTGFPK